MDLDPGAMDGRWWPAPAKLNLFLHVTGRRRDGYHELQTLFQLLDWGDEIYVQADDSRRIMRHEDDYGVPAEQDLVVLAARALQQACDCPAGARIAVRKNIPIGGGLGGGSSDAATALVVLNQLWGCGLASDELARVGLGVGADVPLFVNGFTAIASGVGEELEAVSLGERHYVLVFPDIRVSTARLFEDPALKRDSQPLSPAAALGGEGRNDLESVARLRHPELDQIADSLMNWGRPRMTGSGSTFYLAFDDENAAGQAAEEMKCRYNVRAVRGVDRSRLHEAMDFFVQRGTRNRIGT